MVARGAAKLWPAGLTTRITGKRSAVRWMRSWPQFCGKLVVC